MMERGASLLDTNTKYFLYLSDKTNKDNVSETLNYPLSLTQNYIYFLNRKGKRRLKFQYDWLYPATGRNLSKLSRYSFCDIFT